MWHDSERSLTFHFGKSQDWAVASAERGYPGRVFLHVEPFCQQARALPLIAYILKPVAAEPSAPWPAITVVVVVAAAAHLGCCQPGSLAQPRLAPPVVALAATAAFRRRRRLLLSRTLSSTCCKQNVMSQATPLRPPSAARLGKVAVLEEGASPQDQGKGNHPQQAQPSSPLGAKKRKTKRPFLIPRKQ